MNIIDFLNAFLSLALPLSLVAFVTLAFYAITHPRATIKLLKRLFEWLMKQ